MTYVDFAHNQEQPEFLPNVLAHHLAVLTGHHHHQAHQALLSANPDLFLTDFGPVLCVDDLPGVLAALGRELLRELA